MASQQVQTDIDPALPLDNHKHEEFAFKYALLANATEAYSQVYQCERDTANASGSRLLADHSVRARVDFIQKAQSDVAFATMIDSMKATKVIVHDSEAVLTEVPDHMSRIAAATGILKTNGRIFSGQNTQNIEINANYTLVNMTQAIGIEQVADKIMQMNDKIMQRRTKPHNVIEAQITQTNET